MSPKLKHSISDLNLWRCNLHSTALCDLALCNELHLGDTDVDLTSAMRKVFTLERLSITNNSFSSSSFAILNACAIDLGCFLITCLAIFSLNSSDENNSISNLSPHQS